MEITANDLADFLSVATYGNSWIGSIEVLDEEKHLDEGLEEDHCVEDLWAHRLLKGGHIRVIDASEMEIADADTNPSEYTHDISLENIKMAIDKDKKRYQEILDGDGDLNDGDYLFQIAVFGECIYG